MPAIAAYAAVGAALHRVVRGDVAADKHRAGFAVARRLGCQRLAALAELWGSGEDYDDRRAVELGWALVEDVHRLWPSAIARPNAALLSPTYEPRGANMQDRSCVISWFDKMSQSLARLMRCGSACCSGCLCSPR